MVERRRTRANEQVQLHCNTRLKTRREIRLRNQGVNDRRITRLLRLIQSDGDVAHETGKPERCFASEIAAECTGCDGGCTCAEIHEACHELLDCRLHRRISPKFNEITY
jgi:hypothetical protein